jgi:hypothetical protein
VYPVLLTSKKLYGVDVWWRRVNATLAFLSLGCISLTACSAGGAPSFTVFGAFFPAWLLCGLIGVASTATVRAAFVATGLSNVIPRQLLVCSAAGVIAATLTWLIWFGR